MKAAAILGIVPGLLFLFGSPAFAATIYVPDDHATIQAAIDASADGDTIIVRAGTYYENIDFKDRRVVLVSEDGAAATTIDGGQAGHVVVFHDPALDAGAVLDGFTITNGWSYYGGGIYCHFCSPKILNNVITGNDAENNGGGIYCDDADPVISGNTLSGNTTGPSYSQAGGAGICCMNASQAVISGNIITNNIAVDSCAGGGISCYSSKPQISGNTISLNSASSGGGIYCNQASPDIKGNTVDGNYALYVGCGIACWNGSSPTITDNTITNNTGTEGGGIFCHGASSPMVRDNVICANSVIGSGGGIGCEEYASPFITRNEISGNTAGSGGGVSCGSRSIPVIMKNVIENNSSASDGGGVDCYACSVLISGNMIASNASDEGGGIMCGLSTSVVADNVISGNSATLGGGLYTFGDGTVITNNSITGNSATSGGGFYCRNSTSTDMVIVRNSIFWRNTATTGPEIFLTSYLATSHLDIAWSDVEAGLDSVHLDPDCFIYWGDGMIDADPLWVESGTGDFHLFFDSPCRDSGDAAAAGLQPDDFEGDPRVTGAAPDMGADEYHRRLYHIGDAVPGGNINIRVVGPPFVPSVWLGHGRGILDPPRSTPYGDLYLKAPIVPLPLDPIPARGVLMQPVTVPTSWNPGEEHPFQALVGQEFTNLMVLEVLNPGGGS